ncbi:MAG TPA: hypothetical protein VD763_10050 [Candidatus Saccharimonadales bacterium]|nr:hypothetical protein [Candidatus Saccharimonadales bacterium]
MAKRKRSRHPDAGGDSVPFDPGASMRQIGLFESANGAPHGLLAIIAAVLAALVLFPLARLRRGVRRGD